MKKLMLFFAVLLAVPSFAGTLDSAKAWNLASSEPAPFAAFFQTSGCPGGVPHCTILIWNASADAAANPTLSYNLYKLGIANPTASCNTASMAKAASTSAVTYTDTALSPGQTNCYAVTAALNGGESAFSNTVIVQTPIAPVTGFGVSAKQ